MKKICPHCGEVIEYLKIAGTCVQFGCCYGKKDEFGDDWEDYDMNDYSNYKIDSVECPECCEEIFEDFRDLEDYKEKRGNYDKLLS